MSTGLEKAREQSDRLQCGRSTGLPLTGNTSNRDRKREGILFKHILLLSGSQLCQPRHRTQHICDDYDDDAMRACMRAGYVDGMP